MKIPKVFVSYSHDSQDHKKWVLDLATRLRNTGIDAVIDQWELKPGDDLPRFMEQHLAMCDYVLMVCTNKYVEKANAGLGGVGYEKMIITSDLIKRINSNKVIPLIRQHGTRDVPTFLKTKLFIDFSKPDDFEFSYDELIRTLHNAPLYKKPEIGNNPFEAVEKIRPEKTGDALKELMTIVVKDFEGGRDFSDYDHVRQRIRMSRIMLEMLVEQAKDNGLITQSGADAPLWLTKKGKFYAIEHKIIVA